MKLVAATIRRLERYQGDDRAEFIVGLEFTEMEPAADLRLSTQTFFGRIRHPACARTFPSTIANETITLPELPGVASLFVIGQSFVIAGGFRTVWRTRGPIRGK